MRFFVSALSLLLCCAEDAKPSGQVIGIDLGTTYSCVGILKSGGVEIIPNDQGNRITPSYVALLDDGNVVGEAAKNEASNVPLQVLYDVKRLIGRRMDDETVKKDKAVLPYKIVDEEGKLKIEVPIKGAPTTMTPEEVSAKVLAKLKKTAETYLGESVKDAVVTVPAYFNNAQREATKDAATIAGLNVLRIVNEPTAAAMAYGLDKKEEANIMVYDLGGGTFDVSLLSVAKGVVEVLATNGDTHLGGEDFDQRVAAHFNELFKEKHGKDVQQDRQAMAKLRRAAEKAKLALSTQQEVKVDVESLVDGIDFECQLTRAKFEELNIDLFRKTIEPLKRLLEDGKMKKEDINEVVLVGGSTRIPRIQELLKAYFNGKELNKHLNADEAVAIGASVQAGVLAGNTDVEAVLLDVTPISLGTEKVGGVFVEIVPRNTAIPVTKKSGFRTSYPGQLDVDINIYEGERKMCKDNRLLGHFNLAGFPAELSEVEHDVIFDIDANGIMTVKAKITDSRVSAKKSNEMVVSKDQSRLTKEEIEKIIKDAEDNKEEDTKAEAAATKVQSAKSRLETAEWKLKRGVRKQLTADEATTVDDALAKVRANYEKAGIAEEEMASKIVDPDATKPDGWREDLENAKIPNPDEVKPDDWNEDEDGEWEPEMIDNPECSVGCGKWEATKIDNPEHPNNIVDVQMKIVTSILDGYKMDETLASSGDDYDPELDGEGEGEGEGKGEGKGEGEGKAKKEL
jgi:heat shock protein 5